MRLSLGRKITLLVMGVIVALVVVASVLLTYSSSQEAHARLDEEIAGASRVTMDTLASREERLLALCATIADSPRFRASVEEGDPATILDSARDAIQVIHEPSLLIVTDRKGKELAHIGPQRANAEGSPHGVQEALAGRRATDTWRVAGALYQVATAPVAFGKEVSATLTIGQQVDDALSTRLGQLTQASVLFTLDGRTVARSRDAPEIQVLSAPPGGTQDRPETATLQGQRFRVLSRALSDRRGQEVGAVVICKSLDEALAYLSSLQWRIFGAALGVSVLALVLVVLLTRAMTLPLASLMESTRAVEAGDYDRPVEAASTDEIGLLASRFDEMRVSLKRNIAKLIEEEKMRSQMEVERHRSLSEMVAGVAHEINTPLGIVNQAASMFTENLNPESVAALTVPDETRTMLTDLADAARLMQSNIARANTLISSFKTLSVRQVADRKETVDLPALVQDVIGLFSIKAKAAKLAVEFTDTLEGAHRQWEGYPGHLSQVLMNLLANVERYAYPPGEGGKIEVVLRPHAPAAADTANHEDAGTPPGDPPGAIALIVRDFGAGIPAENLGQIFTPFFTTGRHRGGSGLGLAIVRTLVSESLHGRIHVESEVGRGTTFTVILPSVCP